MSLLEITLRPVEEVDEEILLRVFFDSHPDLVNMSIPDEIKDVFDRQQFMAERHYLESQFPDADLHLIFWKGHYIGRLNVNRGQEAYRILAIALLPEFRNRGIGRRLLEGLLQEARGVNQTVRLQVAWHNVSARSLYERLGFVKIADQGVYCEMQWTP